MLVSGTLTLPQQNSCCPISPSPLIFSPTPTLCLCPNFSQTHAMICLAVAGRTAEYNAQKRLHDAIPILRKSRRRLIPRSPAFYNHSERERKRRERKEGREGAREEKTRTACGQVQVRCRRTPYPAPPPILSLIQYTLLPRLLHHPKTRLATVPAHVFPRESLLQGTYSSAADQARSWEVAAECSALYCTTQEGDLLENWLAVTEECDIIEGLGVERTDTRDMRVVAHHRPQLRIPPRAGVNLCITRRLRPTLANQRPPRGRSVHRQTAPTDPTACAPHPEGNSVESKRRHCPLATPPESPCHQHRPPICAMAHH